MMRGAGLTRVAQGSSRVCPRRSLRLQTPTVFRCILAGGAGRSRRPDRNPGARWAQECERMAGKIFLNYRRGDDPGFTQALYQRLEEEFTAERLFMDVEGHIKPGDDFVDVLSSQVVGSDIVLVLIGRRWIELMAERTSQREDFVAIEIKAALDGGKR